MTLEKIKATEVNFNTMTGLTIRNITFHDYEKKIFVIGRERTKRQFRSLENITFIKGHLDTEALNDRKFSNEGHSRQRCFPASCSDLGRDLLIWQEIKDLPKLKESNIEEQILKAIESAKDI
jgi:hypothetical protein